jgi:hypothetical protein
MLGPWTTGSCSIVDGGGCGVWVLGGCCVWGCKAWAGGVSAWVDLELTGLLKARGASGGMCHEQESD